MIALIPARAGSRRIPGKNTKHLAGHPLVVYTIRAAFDSGVFSEVILATDAPEMVMRVPITYGEDVTVYERDPVSDDQPDIAWVRDVLKSRKDAAAFAILRPTSPFRSAATIRRAYDRFHALDGRCDSLRAVEPAKQSPYKMWRVPDHDGFMQPLLGGRHADGTPYHSSPTQSLPTIYVQTSSLEMSYTRNVEAGTISGWTIAPFFTEGYEGFSIDYPEDWNKAEALIASGAVTLPEVPSAA